MDYDYYEAVKDDIIDGLDNYDSYTEYGSYDEYYDTMYDYFWIDDGVTGNGSGSYFFDAYESEEALLHNTDLLQEALEYFGYDGVPVDKIFDFEWCDVTIRCYLLGELLGEVLEEQGIYDYFENYENNYDEDDDE